MNLAVNYSPALIGLLESGAVDVDLIKLPDWPDLVAMSHPRPVYVHFTLGAAGGQNTLDHVESMLEQTSTRHVNVHLMPEAARFPHIPIESGESAHLREVGDALVRDVEMLGARFGRERVIVETIPYRGAGGRFLRAGIEPAVAWRVVEETGAGFLLDLAHATITAWTLGVEEPSYVRELPIQHLREMHVTGIQHDGEKWRDHMGMADDDWRRLGWALEEIERGAWSAPWVLAFEYGGLGPVFEWRSDPQVLRRDVPKLNARTRRPLPLLESNGAGESCA